MSQHNASAANGFTHQAGNLRGSGRGVSQLVEELLSLLLRRGEREAGAERLADFGGFLCGEENHVQHLNEERREATIRVILRVKRWQRHTEMMVASCDITVSVFMNLQSVRRMRQPRSSRYASSVCSICV